MKTLQPSPRWTIEASTVAVLLGCGPRVVDLDENAESTGTGEAPPVDLDESSEASSSTDDDGAAVDDENGCYEVGFAGKKVIEDHCTGCHNPEVAAGGLVLSSDLHEWVDLGYVVPGDAEASLLYRRIAAGEMPPQGPVAPSEQRIVHELIQHCWPTDPVACDERVPLSFDEQIEWMLIDLSAISSDDRPYTRYLTLADRFAVAKCPQDVAILRRALTKAIHGVSWNPSITNPVAIDPDRTIFRIDIRDYDWATDSPGNPDGRDKWEVMLGASPYAIDVPGELADELAAATGQPIAFMSGLAFIHAATSPPGDDAPPGVYAQMLGDFESMGDLEAFVGIDLEANLANGNYVGAGLNGEGFLERHALPSTGGGLWRTLEDPGGTAQVLFGLPNGFQGYFAHDAVGARLDVVVDPRHGRAAVGVDCIACHRAGIEWPSYVADTFPSEEALGDALISDSARFGTALAAGLQHDQEESIAAAHASFEQPLTAKALAATFGLTEAALIERIDRLPPEFAGLADLVGTVPRSTVDRHAAALACALVDAC